jgi:hypothetical protein
MEKLRKNNLRVFHSYAGPCPYLMVLTVATKSATRGQIMALGKPVDFGSEDDLASAIAEQGQSVNLKHSQVHNMLDI